mgnify:CR=1 FL=1
MKLIVFGLGFSAKAFVEFAHQHFSDITATVTTAEKAARLNANKHHVYVFNDDKADPKISEALREADAILISIGPDEQGDPVVRHFARALEQSKLIKGIGYLSTIGVYGDAQGGWVDETTLPSPSHPRTQMRVKVERQWLDLGQRAGKPVHIFRLAGIYGPGRNPILNLVQRAQRIIKPGQVFNRIHVDDIAQTLLASLAKPRAGAIYNVTDHEPAPPQDGQVWVKVMMPPERRTWPAPRHVGHVTRFEPGSAPEPSQRSHATFLRNEISFSMPRAASSRLISRS